MLVKTANNQDRIFYADFFWLALLIKKFAIKNIALFLSSHFKK
jgi:hypothetical protein